MSLKLADPETEVEARRSLETDRFFLLNLRDGASSISLAKMGGAKPFSTKRAAGIIMQVKEWICWASSNEW